MHRLCVEEHRISVSFINSFVYFITKQWFARFMVLPEFGVIKICPNLVLWRKVTRRKGEDRGLLKKQWKSRRHRWCIERRSFLPILLAIYIQSVYPKKLSRICTLHLCYSMCRRHLRDIAFTSVPSVTPCAYYIRVLVYHSIFRKNQIY